LKNHVVMSQRTPQKCVNILHQIHGCLATKDNHDSWGMCAISIECKTIMITVLTFMSGMDPRTIRVTWIGMVGMLGVWSVWCFGQTAALYSMICLMLRFEKRC
jgi:hypothetical protein